MLAQKSYSWPEDVEVPLKCPLGASGFRCRWASVHLSALLSWTPIKIKAAWTRCRTRECVKPEKVRVEQGTNPDRWTTAQLYRWWKYEKNKKEKIFKTLTYESNTREPEIGRIHYVTTFYSCSLFLYRWKLHVHNQAWACGRVRSNHSSKSKLCICNNIARKLQIDLQNDSQMFLAARLTCYALLGFFGVPQCVFSRPKRAAAQRCVPVRV